MAQDIAQVCYVCKSPELAISIKSVGPLCAGCFIGVVERRVKKDVRLDHPFKKGERILAIDDSSTKSRVMLSLLDRCLGGLPIKLEIKKEDIVSITSKDIEGFSKVLLPLSADDQAEGFLSWLLGDDREDGHKDSQIQIIPFLACLLEEEIEAYAKAKCIKSSSKDPSPLRKDLLQFESRYPGLIHGLLKGANGFKDASQRR